MEMGNGILDQGFAISIVYLRGNVELWNTFRGEKLPRQVLKLKIWSKRGSMGFENTYWNVKDVIVARTDWAARWLVPK